MPDENPSPSARHYVEMPFPLYQQLLDRIQLPILKRNDAQEVADWSAFKPLADTLIRHVWRE